MTAHLIKMHRFINGDGVGLGKTVSSMAAATYLRSKYGTKILVFGTKSTTYQWKLEGFDEFTHLRTHVMTNTWRGKKSSAAHLAQVKHFLNTDEWDVLICKYTSLVGRTKALEGEYDADGYPIEKGQREEISQEVQELIEIIKPHGEQLLLICDEAQKFKSTITQVRKMMLHIQPHVGRIWAMTATVIQNSLDEFYSIASAIGIRPFGNMSRFKDHFCKYEMTYIGKGRQKPTLKGYRNVKEFKIGMRPYYLGRSPAQVKEPLPQLTTRYHPIDLDPKTIKLLDDIRTGKHRLPPSIKKVAGEIMEKERDPDNKMTMMSVMQFIANNPCLIDPADKKAFLSRALSPKEDALLELLEGELRGEKVLVFTKSRRWIDRFEALYKAGHFGDRKFLRITGAESEEDRGKIKHLFQTNPNYDVLFINSAIMEGANLQQAAHMICLDLPWGWGALIQLVGRMIRMSSPHSACTLHILVGKGTIDEYVVDTLKGKKGVFEIILGNSHAAGLLDMGNDLDLASGMETLNDDKEFRALLTAHVKNTSMGDYLQGKLLKEALGEGEDYVMSFERDPKESNSKKRKPFEFSDHWRLNE
jgi:SNF2 family DNA or RNA helicase